MKWVSDLTSFSRDPTGRVLVRAPRWVAAKRHFLYRFTDPSILTHQTRTETVAASFQLANQNPASYKLAATRRSL